MTKNTSYKELKSQKQFLKLVAADIINRLGDSIDAIAFSWIMYEITGSASLMALIFGLNYIPTILLQPIFAVYVERMSKKKVMVSADIGRGIVILLTALLFIFGELSPVFLIMITLTNSTLEAFRMPAGKSIVPKLLSKEHYTTGTGLSGACINISEVAGLASAGFVITLIGAGGALLVDMASFFFSAIIISFIKLKEEKSESISSIKELKTDLIDGIKYIFMNKIVIALFILGMLLNFCLVPINTLITAYVVDNLKQGPEFLSFMQITLVLGLALGSFLCPKLRNLKNCTIIVSGGFLLSLSIISLYPLTFAGGYIGGQILILISTFMLGAGVGLQSVVFTSCIMKNIDPSFLARIGGLMGSFLSLAMPIGALLCSILTSFLSVPVVILIFGICMLLIYSFMSSVNLYKQL
ncbi:MAG: MFS transporter [Oscillospiraceae bacterium]